MDNEQYECWDLEQVVAAIAAAEQLPERSVRAAIELLEDGNTLPFIARYRKEATRGLDETALRKIEDALHHARELAKRKATILKTIDSQGALTPELRQQIVTCAEKVALENLYLPYKPKRRTRATIARERGLQPLADLLSQQAALGSRPEEILQSFVNAENDVPDREAALQGACDIVAEQWSEAPDTRGWLLEQAAGFGRLRSQVKRGKKEDGSKFEAYFDHGESLKRMPSHRLLAMKRGETEGVLRIGLELDDDFVVRKLKQRLLTNPNFEFRRQLEATVEDCYQRLLLPATESAAFQQLKDRADEEAIEVFAKNLRELLLAPPAGPQVTMGIDPGFRTGCKVAVVSETGKFLESATIFPTAPRNDYAQASQTLLDLIARHEVKLIALGNGTASRETDAFLSQLFGEHALSLTKVVVSEAGASVYSASELAAEEYPDLDVTVRGAISIAHRLQDPLAELVKIDPKSIGVGQYQHDVNQAHLRRSLEREVESCVNSVGVDLNTASPALLAHVAGIGPKLARGIVHFRDEQGPFASRAELAKVPKLGPKAFQQAAGFLRIPGSSQPLDNSAVHPESYHIVEKMARSLRASTAQLVGNGTLANKLDAQTFVDERAGLPTIRDIIDELAKPGRDPRREFRVAQFDSAVNSLEDVRPGMVMEGVVTNVTKFGAFVDVGVHQDGLVHISQLANRFVEDPSDEVSVGDVVKVKVLEVDAQRKRISLSRKELL